MLTKKIYLKLLMSLLLVALAVPQGKAETLDVAVGTETNNCVPVHGYYYDSQGKTNQMIYPESLLVDMQGSTITGIKFYCSNANGIVFSGGKLTFTIGTTTQSTFSSASAITITGTVSTAEYVPASGDTEINLVFDTPFEYNEGNIIVQSYTTTKGTCDTYNNYTYFYGITQNSASYCSTAYYGSAQVVDFLPKTTFTYESTGPKPQISATPASLNFSTEVGTPVTNNTVTISGTNLKGNINAEIVDDTNNAYSIDVNSITATGGNAQGTITVTYNPTAAGNHTASLTLSSLGAQPVTIELNGTATTPEYSVSMSDNSGEHDFGAVLVDNTKTWTLTITNNGLQSVTPTLSGIEAPFSTNYTATDLASGESVDIEITFAPTEMIDYSNTITLSFPEAGDAIAAYTCELSGRGVDESYDPDAEKEVVKLITVDKRSIYEPNFIENGSSQGQQLNCYDMRFKMAQPDDPAKQIKAGDLRPGNNLFEFYAIDDFGTEFRFATINLFAEGNAADAPAMYILGEAEGNNWGSNIGVKMDTQDGETFTKQVTFNGKNNENGQLVDYFSFSSKLANTWDAIAQYRLTPVADGNFWITDTYLSNPQNISLVQGTEKSIRIPAGTYNITVNATNKTCLVEKVNDATVASAPRNASKPSNTALDVPIKVTPSVEYYTEDGMPVHPNHTHNTTLNYQEKFYYNINDLVDLEGVIDYVNDTWSANTATNAHPDHYKFQIRGVGQFGDLVTSLTAEYVESHMTGYGNQLVMPEGWERGSFAGPNNEASDDVHTFYYYDLYIKKSFFDERGITGPVTVVVNTTLSGSGFNADNYKAMSVNGVEQIIAKEEFKDYSWTVPLMDEIPSSSIVEQVPMGVVIRLVSTGADFNRTRYINIYGGGTGVSNVKVENIYKSSMNVKAYTQKQVDEDTDRSLVAMNAGAQRDVNVLAYGDPAVTGYDLFMNTSASPIGMTRVSTATHETDGSYTVSSQTESSYNGNYEYERDESLGNIDGMWLNMYKAYADTYYLPVTVANGVGDDGVVRSEENTYGSAMQQVEENGSVDFNSSKCERSQYTWPKDGVRYSFFSPTAVLEGELPAETGYQLYKYRLWVDYDEDAPAWDFEIDVDGKTHLTTPMDRPLGEIQTQTQNETTVTIGGSLPEGGKENWVFVAPADLDKVKLVARFYYKKTSTSSKARPTDKDRLYYVVEKQITVPTGIITGIDNVTSKAVASVKYYNMMGIESDVPFQGVNIEVTTYEDGSRATRKIMK